MKRHWFEPSAVDADDSHTERDGAVLVVSSVSREMRRGWRRVFLSGSTSHSVLQVTSQITSLGEKDMLGTEECSHTEESHTGEDPN